MAILLIDRECALCGKEFETHEEYAYKALDGRGKYIYFCSWKHLQEYRKEKEKVKPKKRHNDNAGMKRKALTAQIIQAYIDGEGATKIASRFGISPNNATNYKYKYKKEIEEGRRRRLADEKL